MMHTSLLINRRIYQREKYGLRLRIKRSRLIGADGIRRADHVGRVMTAWMRRTLREPDAIIGDVSRLAVGDWWTVSPSVVGIAPAFRHIHPDDRGVLETLVNSDDYRAIEIPVIEPPMVAG